MRSTDYEELEDKRLLEFIADEVRGALEASHTRGSGPVYSLAMHLLRDADASEKVTQAHSPTYGVGEAPTNPTAAVSQHSCSASPTTGRSTNFASVAEIRHASSRASI